MFLLLPPALPGAGLSSTTLPTYSTRTQVATKLHGGILGQGQFQRHRHRSTALGQGLCRRLAPLGRLITAANLAALAQTTPGGGRMLWVDESG
jgi:hypothetical protein